MKTLTYIKIGAAVVLLMTALDAPAQKTLQKAKELQGNYDYAEAAALYQKQFTVQQPNVDQARDLANCYLMMNDIQSASTWYGKVLSYRGRTAMDVLTHARLLKQQGRYVDAMDELDFARSLDASLSADVEQEIQSCSDAMKWIQDPVFYEVNPASEFNTSYSEFGLIRSGDNFILASDRRLPGKVYSEGEVYGWTGDPYIKLLSVSGNNASDISEIKGLNANYHNGPAVIDPQSGSVFLTRTKLVKVKKIPVNSDPTSWYENYKTDNYVNRLELYTANNVNGRWENVQPFPYSKPEEYSLGHAAISPDGKVLYFVSDMTGGYGDADIYYSEKQSDGTWGTPQNAGPQINTPGKEVFPYIASDGSLYFSSDGHPGMGGLDLFVAHGSKQEWSVPENLRYPFNSPRDDFSILWTDAEGGYLASNREGGKGLDDIYTFRYAPPTQLILAVKTMQRLEDGSIVPLAETSIDVRSSVNTGSFTATADANGLAYNVATCNANYAIEGSHEGYLAANTSLNVPACTKRNDTAFAELILDKIIINKPIILENIYYDFDKWNIRPDAAVELDKLVKILKDNPRIVVELGSHTDCRGTNQYNQVLSQRRAQSAVDYIIGRGIDASRITAKGYGESMPINNCTDGINCSDEQYQMNRRTEFKILRVNKE